MTKRPDEKADILGRAEIEILVDSFYAGVRRDEALRRVFEDVAKINWEEHSSKICDFWEKVLFKTGVYRGNPLAVHLKLALETPMGRPLFDRWLEIFVEAVDSSFRGENAEHLKRAAADMANVIHARITSSAPGSGLNVICRPARPWPSVRDSPRITSGA